VSESEGPRRFDIPVDGGILAVYEFGAGTDAPPVIAAHGITSNSFSWRAVARALQGRARLIALDLRGRGASRELAPPYGTSAHAQDVLAVLDALALDRAVLIGHSLGGYIVARVGAERPDRVAQLVLVDGGLTAPGAQDVDPQAFADALLGPALARLRMTFATPQAYYDWWRAHPALSDGQVADDDLVAYADHDLVGSEPELRSGVNEEAVRADAGELALLGTFAHRLELPARLLCAPRGLQNEPNPMQPIEMVEAWAADDSERRRALLVPDVNHYTITMSQAGAAFVADQIADAVAAALTRSA
jgi:pimeloyl-ACP methyl ester carboxylesterase